MFGSTVILCGFFDNNGDGKDELYFGFDSGYGAKPRRNILFWSGFNRNWLLVNLREYPFDYRMEDMDGDLLPEIFGNMTAPGNYKQMFHFPIAAHGWWFLMISSILNFPQFSLKDLPNGLFVKSFHVDQHKYYVVLHTNYGVDSTILKPSYNDYLPGGNFLSQGLEEIGVGNYPFLAIFRNKRKDEIVLVDKKIYILNENLK